MPFLSACGDCLSVSFSFRFLLVFVCFKFIYLAACGPKGNGSGTVFFHDLVLSQPGTAAIVGLLFLLLASAAGSLLVGSCTALGDGNWQWSRVI